jgi:hypothetical protein
LYESFFIQTNHLFFRVLILFYSKSSKSQITTRKAAKAAFLVVISISPAPETLFRYGTGPELGYALVLGFFQPTNVYGLEKRKGEG